MGEANLALGRHEESTRAFKVALKLEPGNKSYTDALARVELDKKASDKKAAVDKKVTASGRKVPNPPGVNRQAPAASTPPSLLLLLLRRAQLCRHPTRHPPRGRHPPRHPPWAPHVSSFVSRLARSKPRTSKQSPRRMPSDPRLRRSAHAWRLSKRGAC